jgi:peptidoglycan/LPS O-acetylase OafA/YrhL
MRLSLVFPLIAIAVRKFSGGASVFAALIVSEVGSLIGNGVADPYGVGLTLHYAGFFILGATLAKYRVTLAGCVAKLNGRALALVGITATGLYLWQWLLADWLGWPTGVTDFLTEWGPGLAAAIALILALGSKPIAGALHNSVLVWLGRISYSLYLVHPIVLLIILHLRPAVVPPELALLAVPPVSLCIATMVHHMLESPSQRLGVHLARRVADRGWLAWRFWPFGWAPQGLR